MCVGLNLTKLWDLEMKVKNGKICSIRSVDSVCVRVGWVACAAKFQALTLRRVFFIIL